MRSLAQRKSRLHTTHKSQLVRPPVIPIPKLSQTSEALAKAEEFHSAQMSVELAQLPFLYVDESGFTLDKEVATKVLRNKVFMRQTESLYKVSSYIVLLNFLYYWLSALILEKLHQKIYAYNMYYSFCWD